MKRAPIIANKPCCANCLNRKGGMCLALQEHTLQVNSCAFLFTEEDKEEVQRVYDNRPENVRDLIKMYDEWYGKN